MKTLSLLFSLLLGATVLLIFVQPWDALEKLLVPAATRDAAPAKPLTPPDSTATVETTPAKPLEAAAAPQQSPRPKRQTPPNQPILRRHTCWGPKRPNLSGTPPCNRRPPRPCRARSSSISR